MPLCTVLTMCGNTLPVCIAIYDCTGHMANRGENEAAYIARLFQDKVAEYDPGKIFPDLFFFDGAGSMKKGGQVLTAMYPQAYYVYEGHVTSLFFSDISKLARIKVRDLFICKASILFLNPFCLESKYFVSKPSFCLPVTFDDFARKRIILKTCMLYNVFDPSSC